MTDETRTTKKAALSSVEVGAGAGAAVITAFATSYLGTAGTLTGAALASVVGTVSTSLLRNSAENSARRLRETTARLRETRVGHAGATDIRPVESEDVDPYRTQFLRADNWIDPEHRLPYGPTRRLGTAWTDDPAVTQLIGPATPPHGTPGTADGTRPIQPRHGSPAAIRADIGPDGTRAPRTGRRPYGHSGPADIGPDTTQATGPAGPAYGNRGAGDVGPDTTQVAGPAGPPYGNRGAGDSGPDRTQVAGPAGPPYGNRGAGDSGPETTRITGATGSAYGNRGAGVIGADRTRIGPAGSAYGSRGGAGIGSRVAGPYGSGSVLAGGEGSRPGPRVRPRWVVVGAGAVAAFALSLGAITGIEAIAGQPLSGLAGHGSGGGTTIGRATGTDRGTGSTPSPTPAPTTGGATPTEPAPSSGPSPTGPATTPSGPPASSGSPAPSPTQPAPTPSASSNPLTSRSP